MKSDVDFLVKLAYNLDCNLNSEFVDRSWSNRLRRIARQMDEPRQAEVQKAAVGCEKQKVVVLACIERLNREAARQAMYEGRTRTNVDIYDAMHVTNCPVCTKPMRFQVSASNGHVKVTCEGPCPDWIE